MTYPYADETQRAVDLEVQRLLREAQTRALDLLTTHRPALDRLVDQLLEHETVGGDTVVAALSVPPSRRPATPAGRAGRQ